MIRISKLRMKLNVKKERTLKFPISNNYLYLFVKYLEIPYYNYICTNIEKSQ